MVEVFKKENGVNLPRTATRLTVEERRVWRKLKAEVWVQMQGIFPRLQSYAGPRDLDKTVAKPHGPHKRLTNGLPAGKVIE